MFETVDRILNAAKRLPIFGRRPTPEIDLSEVHRLCTAGVSWRQIARQLNVPRSTLKWRYDRWLASQPEDVPVPDPPPVQIAEEPPATSARPETPQKAVALPSGLETALDGLLEPAPRQIAPAVPVEAPTVIAAEPEQVYPEMPYLFVFGTDADADIAANTYRLNAAAWTDSNVLARMRSARRVYLVGDESMVSQVRTALRGSPVLAKIRIAFGDLEALCVIARRVFVDGNGQQAEVFERFAGVVAAPEPVMRGSGIVADTPWPNSALQ